MVNAKLGHGTAMHQVASNPVHRTVWEVHGIGHHYGGGKEHLRDLLDLGWAASKVDAAKHFIQKHSPKFKHVEVNKIFRVK